MTKESVLLILAFLIPLWLAGMSYLCIWLDKRNMTWQKMEDRTKGKHLRGARKRMWLQVFYASLTGSSTRVLCVDGTNTRKETAKLLVDAAKLVADAAVAEEFDCKT